MNETEQNNQLAEQIQAALIAELQRRNAPYLSATVENFGDINLDFRITYAKGYGNSNFKYIRIEGVRQRISDLGLQGFVADRVEQYLYELTEHVDWLLRISQVAGNLAPEYAALRKKQFDMAESLKKQLKQVKP